MAAADKEEQQKNSDFRFLFKNQVLLFIGAALIGTCIHFVVMKRAGFSNQVALFDAVVSNLLLTIFVLVLKQILDYYHSKHPITIVNIAIIKAFSFVYALALTQIAFFYYGKGNAYFQFLAKNGIARDMIAFLILLLALYQFWLHKNQISQQKFLNQKLEVERQLNKAELANIEQQLQPHFLFNSLNSISALTITQPDEARRMVHLLSDFLRGTLRKELEQEVKLKDELHHLNLYLEIEKVRFGHRLKVDIRSDELCDNARIPSLILQPLVENCIKYGLYGQTGELTIKVEASCENNYLSLSMSNKYDTESVKTSKGTGFGLSSIERKLYLLYAQNDLIKIEKTEDLFTVKLKIPQEINYG